MRTIARMSPTCGGSSGAGVGMWGHVWQAIHSRMARTRMLKIE